MSSYLINELIILPTFFLFLFIYLIRFILVINSDDWFLVWLGLEINIIGFLILIYKRYNIINVESCLKYFFIQRISSALFIGIIYWREVLLDWFYIIILRLKIGAGPFFFWFPSVCSGLRWLSCFFLITFQKIIPLVLINMFVRSIFWSIILLSLFFGVFGSFNQINIKRLIAYSSIHHLGWILLCFSFDDGVWILYLLIYCFVIFNIIYYIKVSGIIDFIMIGKWKNKSWFIFGILSIGGIPPILGFFIRWLVFINISRIDYYYLMILVFISVTIFYVYFRIIYDILIYFRSEFCINENLYFYNNYGIDIIRLVGIILGFFFFIFLF